MPTPQSSSYRMADRLVGGHLAERIQEMREGGLTFEQIARDLHGEAGIEVTSSTVRAWARTLGIHTPDRAAS